MRWVRLTKEFLPPSEQALRARDKLDGDAEEELEDYEDSRHDKADGIAQLLKDLEVPFGERELFTKGADIRIYETIGRMQGESVHKFVHPAI